MENAFHICRAANVELTRDEWFAYCKEHPDSREVVAETNTFQWNIHDVCVNPNLHVILYDSRAKLEIRTARTDDGWVWGFDYYGIMESVSEGGSIPCLFIDVKHATEQDAIKAALRLMQQRDLAPKYRAIIETEYNKRRVVQLTLF